MTNYAIDDGNGNRLTAGLPENRARAVAQRMADERGEPVYLYETGESEAGNAAIRVEPRSYQNQKMEKKTKGDRAGIEPAFLKAKRKKGGR
jgi:hypothetical protein